MLNLGLFLEGLMAWIFSTWYKRKLVSILSSKSIFPDQQRIFWVTPQSTIDIVLAFHVKAFSFGVNFTIMSLMSCHMSLFSHSYIPHETPPTSWFADTS